MSRASRALAAALTLAGAATSCGLTRAISRGESPVAMTKAVSADARRAVERAEAVRQACQARRAAVVPFEEERALGAASLLKLAQHGKGFLVDADGAPGPHAEALRVVNLVGKALAASSSRPTLPWTFVVLVDPRAFVFPGGGGYVAVSTGALALVRDEAQLAGLLAHGVARVAAREPVERWTRRRYDVCVQTATAADSQRAALAALGVQAHQLRRALGTDGGVVTEAEVEALLEPLLDEEEAHGEAARELAAEATAAELLAFSGYDVEAYAALLDAWPASGWTRHAAGSARAEQVRRALGELGAFQHHARRPPVDAAVQRSLATVPLR